MANLDELDSIRALDPGNMYNAIFDLPEQMAKAFKMAGGWNVPVDMFPDVRNVVVVGMGGSAMGGDIARSFLASEMLIPFHICRNYVLPEYVDDETLVIASSYSGNTEETLAAVDDALERSAMIVALTTGGMLEEVAQLNDIPRLKLPAGLQPRAALGFSFVPLMVFLEKIGLAKNVSERLQATIAHLRSTREKMVEDGSSTTNPAKQLAGLLYGKVPLIYAGPTLTDVVASRWKSQICENSKTMAFANLYPEFNHNELVGLSNLSIEFKEQIIVINLRSIDDHEKNSVRMDVVKQILEEQDLMVIDLWATGESGLERIFNLIQMGDFVSYYLAILNDTDPTPVNVIENLKEELSKAVSTE
ncbi:MAG: bifunctional phosphoglucose/phosphomannose isomerase [candidate division Zixibacteria bacterium]|nr:bifunctional phosphoglucose/phosphomannose isomerase [candidate division Zixibacteria bacterium]